MLVSIAVLLGLSAIADPPVPQAVQQSSTKVEGGRLQEMPSYPGVSEDSLRYADDRYP
ncbi:MAG TPA: hypothetical protein VFO41_11710 [Alphaproteobacteria bacterium]|nr:hypothetical protein [Alphaproteobacteria bacterium]